MNLNNTQIKNLLFTISKKNHSYREIINILTNHTEVQFVSFVAIDFSGNGTDEKIPVSTFIENIENLLTVGVQTDGSSVVLQNIATLDNAKVIILPDLEVDWCVDYNFRNLLEDEQTPVGTLRIPSFLVHNGKKVCSRSILQKAALKLKEDSMKFLKEHPTICEEMGILMGMGVVMLFLILTYRGIKTSMEQHNKFYKYVAFCLSLIFAFQSLIMFGGILKLIPLTGITIPFVSYGGSSILSSFIALGILQYASEENI